MKSCREFDHLLERVRACRICEEHLPMGAKPILQASPEARILVVGQAPGRVAHQAGRPFDDASGDRLREWMGVTRDQFYDPGLIAILPMGFCYPGKGRSGDLPPRPECGPAWRKELMSHLNDIGLTLALGRYAQKYRFGPDGTTLTERVRSWNTHWPDLLALPHPSPRNNLWLARNPWFESEVIPALQARIKTLLAERY